ncbi:porin [Modicisalibacter tunisiensis]|uniref:Porin n=1 Tax=Modicisalibacter tunisiensis TaxID=390637 RepID=A0ABS7WZ36_9GAMM|nr:porin [Modicisalibacter tunisiensis]KXS38644.1 MAG: porin [Halomonadaceae bacterium T82-2]MBZ9538709.1 porin [Modicisalibacter tunisiensis]MBZ9567886.1 porin [Modicisalibacter tunisiensis]
MKKTLLATAIAGALGASAAQAATVYNQDGTQVDLYGNIQIGYRSVETATDANNDGTVQPGEGVSSQDDIFDNGTTLGVAAQHQVNPGLVAYLKLELDGFQADELKKRNYDSGDTAYAGLKGNFGDVKIGSYDVLIDDWVKDPVDGSWYVGVWNSSHYIGDGKTSASAQNDTFNDDREGDQIRYLSPSFAGLQFSLGTQYKGDAEAERNGDGSAASFVGGLKYTVGALQLAAVYDDLNTYDYRSYDAGDAYGLSAMYSMNALTLGAKWERYDGSNDTATDKSDMYAVKANYAYGMGNVYATYQYVDEQNNVSSNNPNGSDETYNQVMLGADYSLTPAVTYFVESTMYDQSKDEDDFVATGLAYTF